MRELVIGATGLLLMALSSPAAALQAAEAHPPAPMDELQKASASRAELLALAEAMAPRDAMIRNELELFNRQFATELRKQEGFADLEAQYPALVPELVREMGPPFERYMERMLDEYFAEVATVLGEELDASGVAELTRFYQSPAGQRIVRTMLENFDATEIVDTYDKGQEPDAAMLERGLNGAAARTTRLLSPDDQTALILMMKEPAFWTLRKVNPRILEVRARVMNADDPEFESETASVFERVMTRLAAEGQ